MSARLVPVFKATRRANSIRFFCLMERSYHCIKGLTVSTSALVGDRYLSVKASLEANQNKFSGSTSIVKLTLLAQSARSVVLSGSVTAV